jgi:hypothetical protein
MWRTSSSRLRATALRIRSGKDMGFVPQGSRAANAAAILRWRAWAGIK